MKMVINGERYYSENDLIVALANELARGAAVPVARMCDQVLDPSGRLLGLVRNDVSKRIRKAVKEDEKLAN